MLTDEEYRRFQELSLGRPRCGALIKGSGGLCKSAMDSWTVGNRGGVRIIYFWAVSSSDSDVIDISQCLDI